VAPEILNFDIWALAAATLIAVPVMLTGKRITRLEGAVFVLLYLAFVWVQFDPHKAAHFGAAPAPAVEAAPAQS
jgi:cation:H+ antiporter